MNRFLDIALVIIPFCAGAIITPLGYSILDSVIGFIFVQWRVWTLIASGSLLALSAVEVLNGIRYSSSVCIISLASMFLALIPRSIDLSVFIIPTILTFLLAVTIWRSLTRVSRFHLRRQPQKTA